MSFVKYTRASILFFVVNSKNNEKTGANASICSSHPSPNPSLPYLVKYHHPLPLSYPTHPPRVQIDPQKGTETTYSYEDKGMDIA